METHQLSLDGLVEMLSMHNTGERLLENTLLNDIQADYLESLSTAKSGNVVKQIEWQKWRRIMQEIKKQLKKHILYIMETGATPQILPELIRQYEVLDQKYPDSKQSIESASFEQTFEGQLRGPIKVITALLDRKSVV